MNRTTIDRCADIARAFGVRKLILFGSALQSWVRLTQSLEGKNADR